ncbi:KinB-signaling pathway activation protein [Macrococcoides caseolyticum]|uniref:KinB-signaling pathway activation protein n=1 Tax=Macrococcoides caseolyticum TaxID=69966 RepID=UPI001F1D9D47|nr:KinB-signaling pathway activation protein [Macrococcus caseolyticus]MCE4957276.1 KinB-signaling pathway activation protein [Macrococcus caseolyticus]
MTLKNLGKFYGITLLIGLVCTIIVSLVFGYDKLTVYLFKGEIGEFLAALIWFMGYGLLIASISQLAFFAYLFIHQMGRGIFKGGWNAIQVVIILFAIIDLVYFRYLRFGKQDGDILKFIWIPILIVIFGTCVAIYKNKLTGKNVFIPAMFFMVVMTTVELIPFLKVKDMMWLYCTIFSLLLCNAYQLLSLPKYNQLSFEERKARKMARGTWEEPQHRAATSTKKRTQVVTHKKKQKKR